MKITIKPNEKLYINGAVLRFETKTSIEIINDAVFLLQSHVMQKEDTDTPLKQLYFAAQLVLMNPKNEQENTIVFFAMLDAMQKTYSDVDIIMSLEDCRSAAKKGKYIDVMKILRSLFNREAEVMQDNKMKQTSGKLERI